MKKAFALVLGMLFLGNVSLFSQNLIEPWQKLLKRNVSSEGIVNYEGFKAAETELWSYLSYLGEHIPKAGSPSEEIMAFWINAYNASAVYYVVSKNLRKSIKENGSPWDDPVFPTPEGLRSLNYIEHEILRKMGDARVHFAINCASVSCPKLSNKAFVAKTLQSDLDSLTHEFLKDESRNTWNGIKGSKVSKIFKWFEEDFVNYAGSVPSFLEKYGPEDKIESYGFMDYNWDLNGNWK